MLRVFLRAMPKGADLHTHLGGVPSAEDFLGWAAQAGYCLDRTSLAILPAPCKQADRIGLIAETEQFLYARLVDHVSTRGWQIGVGADEASGHTQFFISFDRLAPLQTMDGLAAKMLTVALRTAARGNVTYVEMMHSPREGFDYVMATPAGPLDEAGIAARYAQELPAAKAAVAKALAGLDRDEAQLRQTLACGTRAAEPACDVKIKYLSSTFRGLPPGQAFRTMLMGFALADADPRFLGVNIVQPEDWPVALRDYDLHMAMFRFLGAKYPKVKLTMHAGEVTGHLVAMAETKDHIRKALDAGARRIGHGVGIAFETEADATLRRMARERIPVEINLTSNAVILNVKGAEHPLHLYRRYGVPVMLSTDDEGLLRTDLTNEMVRAVTEQGLGYADLKEMSRNSLEFAFLPGASLWQNGKYENPVRACSAGLDSQACKSFLASSEKAFVQARFEQKISAFEKETTIGSR